MVKTTIEPGYRVVLPESIRAQFHVGDEIIVEQASDGRIIIAPAERANAATVPTVGEESALGRELRALRQRIVDSGASLLDMNELELELSDRRGELHA
ncbi:MAG: AbrB/MazE/SpoVT family DNA-binding domain-containing protein [Caldilineaceae bacterium]|jgi:bifunctional DNA-binding transcriptional regulator/antitoxin component of YhaV-PrlF toxin-antitoxin module|nr:AbrB/MazE/SpoVT family DNA-binding domain-containing protein [Caldilineaceae bacterium]